MEKTQLELFTVKYPGSPLWSNSGGKKWVWFKVLEGEDQGVKLRVPLYESKDNISTETYETLCSLERGETVKAVLKRQSPEDPWIPEKIIQLEQ
jgi:hypothetical protein